MKSESEEAHSISQEEWEKAWQEHWEKTQMNYELPTEVEAVVPRERDFLRHSRSFEKEMERLEKVHAEFVAAIKKMQHIGPAVTIFGSARFKP